MAFKINPKVAVVIPTYNRWPYVCDAIESVLQQTYPDVEAVVVDDASTDGTAEKLAAKYGNRIRLIALDKNGEKSAARNAGIRATDALYICMLDSDDLLTENAVADRMRLFLSDSSFTGVAYGLIKVNGKLKRKLAFDPEGDVLGVFSKYSGFINNNSWIVSREKLLSVGLFNEQLTNMEDRELLLRLAAALEFRCCKTVTQDVRRVDVVSARSNYDRLIQQGKKYIQTVRANDELVRKLGPLLMDLEFSEDKTISDAFYKAGRYREYRPYSRRMFSKYGSRLWRFRFLRRHALAIVRSGLMMNKKFMIMAVFLVSILLGVTILYSLGWDKFWSLLHVPAMNPCFADMRTIQSGLISFTSGINPQFDNAGDFWGRTMNYPLVWLDIARFFSLADEAHFLIFCTVVVVAFLVACAWLLYRFPSVFLLVGVFSFPSLLAIERCNNDMIIFLLLLFFSYSRSVLSGVVFGAAVLLKVYPVFILHSVFVRYRYWRVILFSIIALCSLLFSQLDAITSGNTAVGKRSYGTSTAIKIVGKRFTENVGLPVVRILSWVVYIVLARIIIKSAWLQPFYATMKRECIELNLFMVGGVIYVYTYLFASNWDYRLIFLILCIPYLVNPSHGWRGKSVAGLMLLAMNANRMGSLCAYSKALLFVVLGILIWIPIVNIVKANMDILFVRISVMGKGSKIDIVSES